MALFPLRDINDQFQDNTNDGASATPTKVGYGSLKRPGFLIISIYG
jgi:hypothetical protein